MLVSRKAHRFMEDVTEPVAGRILYRADELHRAYARDPFRHLDEGHVVVLDLETMRPTRLDPWPHQRELVAAWVDLEELAATGRLRFRNVHEEKSRQMGITWIVAYVLVWALRWHPLRALAMSLKLSEIADSGFTVDSFFGRMRFIAEYVDDPDDPIGGWPEPLRPELTFVGGNDPIVRSASTGFVTGSGATPDPGRGGKYDCGFLDEHARISYGKSVQAAITRAIPSGRLYNSTPEGEDNEFARLRATRPRGYVFLRHHWTAHPLYSLGLHRAAKLAEDGSVEVEGAPGCALCAGTIAGVAWSATDPRSHRFPGRPTSPWYEQAILDLDDQQVAAELEIDYTASLTARVYPEFSEERHVAAGEIALLPGIPVELGWDYGFETTSVVIAQDTPLEYRIVGEVELHDAIPEEVARALKTELSRLGLNERELGLTITRGLLAIGDPAGEARGQTTGRSIVEEYRREGFSISSTPRGVDETIRATKRLLNGRPKDLVVSQRCPQFIRHIKHNRWETDRQGRRKPDGPIRNDEHNHMMRALAYLVSWKFPAPDVERSLRRAVERTREASGRIDEEIGYEMKM